MAEILLHNLRIIDPFGEREFLEHASILIEGDHVKFVGRGYAHVGFKGEILDMQGKTVLPGIINAHTHLYSTLAMGMPPPQKSPKNFVEHLEEVWWKLDRGLDQDSTRASFEAGLMDCIRNGTTTIIDHHASPEFIEGSLDILAELAESFGVNISLCFESSDRNGKDNFKAELLENVRAIKKYSDHPYICPRLGLHASFTLSDESLKMVGEQLKQLPNCGIHIHVAEDLADEKDAQARGYRSVIQRLDDFELLSNQSLIIHGIFMTREDRHILLKRGCKLIHNPTSNANNQVGVLESEIIEAMSPGLGTDGMQNNMLKEAKEGTLVRAATDSSPVDYLEMLFANNPDISVKIFGLLLGHIEEAGQADLVFYDYEPRTELNSENYKGHLLFGLGLPSDVMTRGVFRMRNNHLVDMDESRIRENARKQSQRLWSAIKAL